MKRLQNTFLLLALLAAGTAWGEVPLKIYSGKRDTVATAVQTETCVTAPGATATINGKDVHVYKTGSFAAEVPLAMGDNKIEIKAMKDGQEDSTSFNIFRRDATPKKAVASGDLSDQRTTSFDNPVYVKTLPGAYLQFGNGDDRLGGSKMGFVADGITLKADGEKGSLYRVALSKNRFAYIPKEYTEPASGANPVVNTGSWSVANVGDADRVTVSLPTRLAYQYRTEIDPSTITIDLFGATDNSNWITQRSVDLGMIDYVNYEQVESDVYRIVIRLKDKYQWGFTVGYEGNNLTVDVRHRPANIGFKDLVIGLDAGHGGPYPGAISPSGITEKEVNLDIILRLGKMLEAAGAKVVYTRDGDTGPSMGERKRIMREAGVQLGLSVHNNSGGGPLASPGTSTYYKHLFDRPLAETVLRRMLQLELPLYGLVGNFNFSLNGPTDYPNTLVEAMFMSSLAEEEKLADPEFRQRIARQIYLGLDDYLKAVKASLKSR